MQMTRQSSSKPNKKDVTAIADILTKFGEVTGFKTKFGKSSVIPIGCQGVDLDEVLCAFPARRAHFPTKYLGLLLSNTRLRRIDFQPLINKAVSKLTVWNGKNINHAGMSTLVKAVLTSQSVYCLTSLTAPKSTLKEIDNLRKSFLWAGSEKLTGGKCKVNWPHSIRPSDSGGLGILHLGKFARALRLRWLWKDWEGEGTILNNPDLPCDVTGRLLFATATSITIGDDMRAFWSSAWLQGQRPQDIAPNIFQISKNKNKSIYEGMQNKAWIRDIDMRHTSFSPQHFMENVQLWNALSHIELHPDREDNIVWKFNLNGKFTTGSAYHAQFIGATVTNFNCLI